MQVFGNSEEDELLVMASIQKVYLPQATECDSEETALLEIVLAIALDRNWHNALFIEGANLNSRLDMPAMAVRRTCSCWL